MKTILGVALGLGVITIGYIAYAMSKKKEPLLEETVNGNLKFEDIVAYFKTLSMVQDKQVPFLALPDSEQLKAIIKVKSHKAKALVAGVYDTDNDRLNPVKIIYADGFNEKLTEVLGNEKLVVLN